MSALLETGLFVMDFARRATMGFLQDIEGDAFHRLFCEGGSNAGYIVGQLAYTDDMTLHMLAGKPSIFSEDQQKMFAGGADPAADCSRYPGRDELIAMMVERRETLTAYFKGQSDEDLTTAVEGPLAQFGDTRAKLMTSIAWHEGMHAGQLTVIRRQLDLPRVFG
ncbi:MAG: DinB family protein [Planctomycetota bacterium]